MPDPEENQAASQPQPTEAPRTAAEQAATETRRAAQGEAPPPFFGLLATPEDPAPAAPTPPAAGSGDGEGSSEDGS